MRIGISSIRRLDVLRHLLLCSVVGCGATGAYAQTSTPGAPSADAGVAGSNNSDPAAPIAAVTASAAVADTAVSDTGDIVVTARRREESIQRVPVSVTAVTPALIEQRGLQATTDLQRIVPGVIFNGSGSDANTNFTIRGQGKDVIGAGLPSVISYFNEVPLPSWGAVLPTFDVANIQVLKGPQGTLFGRNTTGGAVLVYSQTPKYEFEGYAQATLGDYFWHALEGAVNVPIVTDKIALRVAGNYVKRDGFTKNLSGFADSDNLNSRALRASLLIEPTDWLKNTTVYDWYRQRTNYAGTVAVSATAQPLYKFGAAAFGPVAGPLIDAGFNCTTSINCNVDQQLARQRATGPRTTYSDVQPIDRTRVWGIANTTQIDLGGITIKNIFGYRENHIFQVANTDGLPVALFNTIGYRNDKQISDELQFSGSLLNDRLTYLFGGFYLDTRPDGPIALGQDSFRPSFIPVTTPFIGTLGNNLYTDKSQALFGSLTYELFDGFKLNGGYRHTWDKEGVCASVSATPVATPARSLSECRGQPGSFDQTVDFDASTWSAGFDYQLSSQVFTYGVVRRGYRAGGLNTPGLGGRFTQFQTYQPQTVTDVELGVKTNWRMGDMRGRLNLAAFRGKYKDLQRLIAAIPPDFDGSGTTLDDPTNTVLIINSGKARVQGIEVDAFLSPVPGLDLNGALSYLDTKFTDFTIPAIFSGVSGGIPQFFNSPKWSYSVSGRYTLPVELNGAKFSLLADYYWTDDYLIGTFTVPSYGIANLNFEVSNIGNTPLKATVFVNNLTNKLYFRNFSLSGLSPGVYSAGYGEPRMYGVRLRYDF